MQVDPWVVVAGLAIVALGLAGWFVRLGLRRLNAAEAMIHEMRRNLDVRPREQRADKPLVLQIGKRVLHLSERMSALEYRIGQLSERQQQLKSRVTAVPDYETAIRMAQHGAKPDRLVLQCGLERGEAELMVSIHGAHDDRGSENDQ